MKHNINMSVILCTLMCYIAAFSQNAHATDAVAAPHKTAIKDAAVIFSAPPRETEQAGKEKYEPIANYLSKELGKTVIYRHPGTWGVYRTEMLQGKYDIVFDGPHFNSYRAEKLQHNILAKIPVKHQFVVITSKSNRIISKVNDLAGRSVCAHAPPNLGTLTLLKNFDNPMRQPVILNTKGWKNIYNGVIKGKCNGGILPLANLDKYDANRDSIRVVYTDRSLPNQAFSAGPRLSSSDQLRIMHALTSDSASNATATLRSAYRVGDRFVPASNREYRGIAAYLKNEWGYYE